ncbi:pesticin C-terminus-like muramidase [uncultured Desulfovibrio sp.]|uniref:pesticin C-terminus-like muramidase n=1 Tax=uncultured Desulfovibrio sp. TaxID=167968 RepID=UPI002633B352|nr:pesticin C-terminus-like muramidase [uncultured Desulfovibrio sp.]
MKGIHLNKIIEVLHRPGFEGPQQLRGYIPCHLTTGGTANYTGGPSPERYVPMGISGVTVGTGVDLGQTDAATLADIGVEQGLINRLRPYLGQRKADAVDVLRRLPLIVSQDVADELDAAMLNHHIAKISASYDRAVGAPGRFATLPWQAQAAIVSIQYQRGVKSPRKYPNTWSALVRQDWADAAARLGNGRLWSGYQRRRGLEGKLLEQLL